MITLQEIKQMKHPRCVLAREWFTYYEKYSKVNCGKVCNIGTLFPNFCKTMGIKGCFLDMCRYERMQCNQCK